MMRAAQQFLSRAIGRQELCDITSSRALIHTSKRILFPDVVVPPLGESVSEGTISAVLKQPGQNVAVDEVVAQLETDKVTIDCKSAHAGVVSNVQVKVGDVVKPGSVLCVVGEGSSATSTASTTASPSAAAQSTAAVPSSGHHRTPAIKFPPRMTTAGKRISDLSASDADAALQALSKSSQTSPAAVPAAAPGSTPVQQSAKQATAAKTATAVKPSAKKADPGLKPSQATQYLKAVPERRAPTAREMDMINSGGAF